MTSIEERYVAAAGVRAFVRSRPGVGPPTVFVHGSPTSSADWLPFLERHPGPAIAFDLPGFGASERPPPKRFEATVGGYADFVEALLGELAIDRYRLALHDWGVVALVAALREPERLERLAVVNAVPLLPGFRWHWLARIWRRRGLGELSVAAVTKPVARLLLRQARPGLRPMPDEFIDAFWPAWDAGMRRAMLSLYRSADPELLAAAGQRLGEVRCPALVVWGAGDAYIPVSFARAWAERLPSAELRELDRAGHWPWIDRPETVGLVVRFLAA